MLFKRFNMVLCCLSATLLLVWAVRSDEQPAAQKSQMSVSIAPGECVVVQGEAGSELSIDGCAPFGETGDPKLVARSYTVILPRDTDLSSVSVTLESASFEERSVRPSDAVR